MFFFKFFIIFSFVHDNKWDTYKKKLRESNQKTSFIFCFWLETREKKTSLKSLFFFFFWIFCIKVFKHLPIYSDFLSFFFSLFFSSFVAIKKCSKLNNISKGFTIWTWFMPFFLHAASKSKLVFSSFFLLLTNRT